MPCCLQNPAGPRTARRVGGVGRGWLCSTGRIRISRLCSAERGVFCPGVVHGVSDHPLPPTPHLPHPIPHPPLLIAQTAKSRCSNSRSRLATTSAANLLPNAGARRKRKRTKIPVNENRARRLMYFVAPNRWKRRGSSEDFAVVAKHRKVDIL